ncbi:hypothetical protein M427DRAFT_282802 [Gonapodya prolifera JEL478]|uniref:Cyclic nucleotide-binding domain-containing protein n=1 Tax=Gonapodya prolifera (strain JEL478) TaxID=1344416 RepID=A0A139AZ04_GONPJ|nr:hypothetical protein M427DRAFT_282802 [Gonapodya prolifera JEL478]|eukprot:KXS21982.1 hypothetical protein M427DRAFT_282802 [Gonapodya prolifera JEL478]
MTKRYTELLMVTKEDFERVISETTEKEILKRVERFREIPLFRTFPVDARKVAEACRIDEYPPNTTIIYEGDTASDTIYFLLRGHCRVVKLVNFRQTTLWNNSVTLSRHDPGVPLGPQESVATKLLVVAQVNPGQYFGEGSVAHVQNKREAASAVYSANVVRRGASVVAEDWVETISMSRGDFLKFASDRTFATLRGDIGGNITLDEMIVRYLHTRKRDAYKKRMVKEILERKASQARGGR